VSVEVLAAVVVDRGCAIGVSSGELHVAQRDTGIDRGHDERGAKHVQMHISEPGSLADRSHPPMRSAPIESLSVPSQRDRTLVAFRDREVDGARRARHERDGGLVALADDSQRTVSAFEAESPALVAQASVTRSPLRPSSTVSAAWAWSECSAVNRMRPSSPRSMP
jgi:hypothetical protein